MFDAKARELSPEALRFITTAAKIQADGWGFTLAVNYIARRPVTPGLGQRLAVVLSLKWQLRLYLFMGWPIDNSVEEHDLERKLEDWQVMRLQIIRAFEHEPSPERKRQLAETLKRFEAGMPPSTGAVALGAG